MYLKANFRCLNFNHFFDKLVKNRNFEFPSSIENLWGILAQKIYEGGWEATTQQELISRCV
jgi:hypothetical protein